MMILFYNIALEEIILKKKILMLIIIATAALSGCGNTVNLSEQQSDMIAEYTAGIVLKYDKHYDSKLLKQNINTKIKQSKSDLVPADEVKTDLSNNVETTISGSNATSEQTISNSTKLEGNKTNLKEKKYDSLSTVMNQDDFDISYTKSYLRKDYPNESSDSYFTLESKGGNQFLVVEFSIKNKTKKQKTINMLSSKINYILYTQDGISYYPSITLLENDIQTMNTKVMGSKSKKAVLIFEVVKDFDINDLELVLTKNNKSALINIK